MTEPYQAPAPGQAPDLYGAPEPGGAAEPQRAVESSQPQDLYRAPEQAPAAASYPAPQPQRAAEPYEAMAPQRATEPYQPQVPYPPQHLYRAPQPVQAPAAHPTQEPYPVQGLYRPAEPTRAADPSQAADPTQVAHLYPASDPYLETEPPEAPGARRAAPLVEEEEEEEVAADVTSFPGAVGWTIAGTILPGLGFLRAKRWGEGIMTLIFFLVIVCGVGYLAYQRTFALKLMTSPITLLGIAVLCGMLAILVTGIILSTYLALRPHVITSGQRIIGGVLVIVLSFLVCVPLAVGAGFSLSQAGIIH